MPHTSRVLHRVLRSIGMWFSFVTATICLEGFFPILRRHISIYYILTIGHWLSFAATLFTLNGNFPIFRTVPWSCTAQRQTVYGQKSHFHKVRYLFVFETFETKLPQESHEQRRLPSPPEIEYGDWSAKKVEDCPDVSFVFVRRWHVLAMVNQQQRRWKRRRWWKSVEVDGKWMKVDLKVTNNKMSLKKVEETEFQRTARILGVLFPAPPISSATSIPGPGSYC